MNDFWYNIVVGGLFSIGAVLFTATFIYMIMDSYT